MINVLPSCLHRNFSQFLEVYLVTNGLIEVAQGLVQVPVHMPTGWVTYENPTRPDHMPQPKWGSINWAENRHRIGVLLCFRATHASTCQLFPLKSNICPDISQNMWLWIFKSSKNRVKLTFSNNPLCLQVLCVCWGLAAFKELYRTIREMIVYQISGGKAYDFYGSAPIPDEVCNAGDSKEST